MVKTKGFRPPKRTATLTFDEDHDYHGAEIECHLDAPMGLVFEFQRIGDEGADQAGIMRDFGDRVLIAWNLEDDDGQPIPATGEGLLAQPFAFAYALIEAWGEAAAQPSAPLGRR